MARLAHRSAAGLAAPVSGVRRRASAAPRAYFASENSGPDSTRNGFSLDAARRRRRTCAHVRERHREPDAALHHGGRRDEAVVEPVEAVRVGSLGFRVSGLDDLEDRLGVEHVGHCARALEPCARRDEIGDDVGAGGGVSPAAEVVALGVHRDEPIVGEHELSDEDTSSRLTLPSQPRASTPRTPQLR
jgi:hypothetical protein